METATGRENAQLAIQLAADSLFPVRNGGGLSVCGTNRRKNGFGVVCVSEGLFVPCRPAYINCFWHLFHVGGICTQSLICFALRLQLGWNRTFADRGTADRVLPGYAAGCLFAAFGGQGLLLALGLFGLRCFVTVTCFFLLAVPAWQSSVELFQMSFGRGHSFTAVYGHRWWLRLACVAGAICFGILLDIRLSPGLLRLLLANGI